MYVCITKYTEGIHTVIYNTKGKFLTQVEKWLDTIRPTSVEAERCFSAAGLFASKVRNRLGDEILSVLQILRFYFAKHANKQDAP